MDADEPDHDEGSHGQPDEQGADVVERGVAGHDAPDAERAGRDRDREGERRDQVPEDELAVMHLGRTRDHGGREEHGQPSPFRVGPFALLDHSPAAFLMLARALQQELAPTVAHRVPDEATGLARHRGHTDHHGQIETALAGGDRGGPEGGRADEGDARPRRRHREEQEQVLPPGVDGDARGCEDHGRGPPARPRGRGRGRAHVAGDGLGALVRGAPDPASSAIPTMATIRPRKAELECPRRSSRSARRTP